MNPDEPEFLSIDGKCPSWMPAEARKVWKEYFDCLKKAGVLRENSIETFAKWCIAAAKTRKLAKKTDKDSMVEWRQTMSIERLLAVELGMTPASQTRICVDKPKEEKTGVLDGLWQKQKKNS